MARERRIARPVSGEMSDDQVRYLTREDYSDEELAELQTWAAQVMAEREQQPTGN